MKYVMLLFFIMPFSVFSQKINGIEIPDKAKNILINIMNKSGVDEVTITSAYRSAEQQVNVMYNYISIYGINNAKKLYGPEGDTVVDVYAVEKKAGKTAQEIKQSMLRELKIQLPSAIANNRLMHVGREEKFIVFDISISKIKPSGLVNKFQETANSMVTEGILHRFLGTESGEKDALHFEILK